MKNLVKELFLQNVTLFGDRVALETGDQKYSYTELNCLVERITELIQQLSIQSKAIVVLNDHSAISYASLLAISFSGNTILPIESSWPKQRIEAILQQAKPAAITTTGSETEQRLIQGIEAFSKIIHINALSAKVDEQLNAVAAIEASHYEDISYLIFTSGTTGVPKGVPVKQESLNAFISFYKSEYDFNEKDRFLQVYELTFDVAYFSFFVPLCCGACCCILNAKRGVPKYLFIVEDLMKLDVTVVSMVPTVLHFIRKYLKNIKAPKVRYSFFSGDALYHSEAVEWQKFVPNAAVRNCYGPTETTIVCTQYEWQQDIAAEESYNDIVPLGKPFPDMQFAIVDEDNQEVERGKVGELCFSGAQVIDTYLNNAHEEKFFTRHEGEKSCRYYKTGDLASLNENGNFIFHGRADHQVKINGYRIELEEVEQALQKVVGQKCIVVKKRGAQNIDFLKAYIEGEVVDQESIRTALLQNLPEYMIPAQFEYIEQIPLSENGKVDKKYLQSV